MNKIIFDLQSFSENVNHLSAGSNWTIDGIKYTAVKDTVFNVDDDGKPTGIASGTVTATIAGVENSPTITFNGSTDMKAVLSVGDSDTINVKTDNMTVNYSSGDIVYNSDTTVSVGKNSEFTAIFDDNHSASIKTPDTAGGKLAVTSDSIQFTPDQNTGELEFSTNTNGATDTVSIETSGTITYKNDGKLSVTEGTVIKDEFSDDHEIKITANSDTSDAVTFTENGWTISPNPSNALTVSLTDGDTNLKFNKIDGTVKYSDGTLTLSDGTEVSGSSSDFDTISAKTESGTAIIDFTTDKIEYQPQDGATLTLNFDEYNAKITSGKLSTDADNFSLSSDTTVTANLPTAVKLETAGTYNLNGTQITTTEDEVEVYLKDNNTLQFEIGEAITVEGHTFSGVDGTMVQVKDGEISVILYKKGTASIDGETFELTENVSDGIEVTKISGGFAVSHILTSEEAQKYGDADSDVGKTFTENVTITGDTEYNISLRSSGVLSISGISNNANIKAVATLGGNTYENGTGFTVETDEAGTINFGTNSYKTDDDSVYFGVDFDKDGNGTISEISELVGTISGDFGDIEEINSNNVTIVSGADNNATITATKRNATISGLSDGAEVSLDNDNIGVHSTGQMTVNDATYKIGNDSDGVIISSKIVSGLDENATLNISKEGTYTVNNTKLNVSANDIIFGVTEDYAYIYDEDDLQINSATSTADILNALGIPEKNTTYLGTSESETVTFADTSKNAAVVSAGASDIKIIELGDKGNAVIVESTTAPVTITGGAGNDTLITQGENVIFDMSEGGADLIIATGGKTTLENYDPETDAGIKLTLDDVKAGVKFGAGKVQLANNAEVNFGSDSNRINIYTPDGSEEKIAFTTPEDKNLDYSSDTENLMLVANNASLTTEVESATLKTGSGNDTIYGGKGSSIDAGAGKNLIKLSDDGGATVSAAEGKNTLDNFNFVGDDAPADKLSTGSLSILNAEIQKGDVILKNGNTRIQINDAENQNIKFENEDTNGETVIQFGDKELELNDDAKIYWAGGNNATVSIGEDYTNTETAVTIDLTNTDYDSDTMSFKGDVKDVDAQDFAGAVEITGNDRYNKITAGKGGSTLDGGEGNDTLIGGEGSDTFIFGAGKDLISNFDVENDKLESANLAIEKVEIKGDNIVMITESGSKATIEGVADKTLKFENKYTQGTIEVQFSDDAATINNDADFYWFSGKNATVTLGSDSTLESANVDLSNYNFRNKDKLSFHGDVKTLDASEYTQAATLSGSSWKNNVIKASKGGSELWGGGATNDTLFGGDGADTFIYGAGDGKDVIENATASDTVKLNNVTLDDISSAISGSDIQLNFNDGGTLTLKEAATSNVTFEIGSSSYTVNQTSGELEAKS